MSSVWCLFKAPYALIGVWARLARCQCRLRPCCQDLYNPPPDAHCSNWSLDLCLNTNGLPSSRARTHRNAPFIPQPSTPPLTQPKAWLQPAPPLPQPCPAA